MSTATTAQEISEQYAISVDEFEALDANLRALYRAAYAADVLRVQEFPTYGTPGNPEGMANTGPDVDRYLATCGFPGGGEPWCAAFGTQMLVDSGVPLSQLPSGPASVHNWMDWALAKGWNLDEPVRGCAALIRESATAGHFTLVSQVAGDEVHTIEGNTNPNGSPEGYGVFRRVRSKSEFHVFADLSNLTSV